VLRPRAVSYSRELPASEDVLLAVEVADTTVRFDRLVKARLYARAGIAEFWLCLPVDGAVEVYRGPGADGYASVTRHGAGQLVSPLAFPEVGFAVTDFFPEQPRHLTAGAAWRSRFTRAGLTGPLAIDISAGEQ
jgi:Uma2 family endonuclease